MVDPESEALAKVLNVDRSAEVSEEVIALRDALQEKLQDIDLAYIHGEINFTIATFQLRELVQSFVKDLTRILTRIIVRELVRKALQDLIDDGYPMPTKGENN